MKRVQRVALGVVGVLGVLVALIVFGNSQPGGLSALFSNNSTPAQEEPTATPTPDPTPAQEEPTATPNPDPALVDNLTGHTASVRSVAFSPDGTTLASGSWDDTIRLWDVNTGQTIGEPLQGHADWVRSVAFSPDGQTLASGSYDETVRLWDVATALEE
jgi:WD40 repeat protein